MFSIKSIVSWSGDVTTSDASGGQILVAHRILSPSIWAAHYLCWYLILKFRKRISSFNALSYISAILQPRLSPDDWWGPIWACQPHKASICAYHCQRRHRKVPITHLKVCCDSKKEIVQFFLAFCCDAAASMCLEPCWAMYASKSRDSRDRWSRDGMWIPARKSRPVPDETGRDQPLIISFGRGAQINR